MHSIENIIESSIEQIKRMVDVNTVIGDAVTTADGTMLLPVSRVCIGFATGGGEYEAGDKRSRCARSSENSGISDANYPFSGATAVGMSLKPLAFLSVEQGNVRVLPAAPESALDKLADLVPQMLKAVERFASEMLDNRSKKCENRMGRYRRRCAVSYPETAFETEGKADENRCE